MRLLFLLGIAVSAPAATYFVSGTGSDSNSGLSESSAFQTIQTAANRTMPGDVVSIMNGVYTTCDGCNIVDISRSGTAASWITYQAYPGHRPLLSLGTGWNAIFIHGGAAYIEISGLQVQGNRLNVTLSGCTDQAQQSVPDPACNGNGISVDGRQDGANKPHHILIEHNEVYDALGGGISAIEADYVTVEDNFVHENAWYSRYACSGISMFEAWNYDSGAAPHTIVQRNRVFNNRSLVPWMSTGQLSDGDGIIIDTSRNNQAGSDNIGGYTGGFLVQNNLSVNNGGGGLLSYQSDQVTFLNNTVYGNGLVVGYADVFVNQSGSVNVWNNVVESASTGTAVNVFGSTGVQIDYNIYFNGGVNATLGAHDLTVNPQFNTLGTDPATSDFHVMESSAAAQSGNAAVAPAVDLEGVSRPQQPGVVTRGAYESVVSNDVLLTAGGIVNAASYAGGSVAPGELVTLFGVGFGPGTLVSAAFGSNGYLPVDVGDTRVYFDAVAAPMIYADNQQVSAVAPYEISGTTEVQVESGGRLSEPVAIPVSGALPGIYCYSGGNGQAVAVTTNPDQSQAFNQDDPAPQGSYLTFFVTGEGSTVMPWADGMLPTGPQYPSPAGAVTVFIGGLVSNCSGNFVGLIYPGVTQVNACVPAGTPVGDAVSLVVSVSGIAAQGGVTVRIAH